MANSTTHNALREPIYGALYNVPLVWLDADGDPTPPVSMDVEVSKDNGTFANTTNAPTLAKEVGGSTDSAYGYVTLTAAEMAADVVTLQAKDSTQKATPVCIRPLRLPVLRDSQCQAGGNSTATLDSGASAVDDYYNGCILLLDADTGAGQARVILDYVGSTKVATIAGTWETNPDATSDYQVLATEAWTHLALDRVLLGLPAVAAGSPNGLPLLDANSLVQADTARLGGVAQSLLDLKDFADTGYDPATHQAQADVTAVHGSALTETSHGRLAAAWIKFGDVATPALTADEKMRGTDSAALASDWSATRAGYIDQLNGATDGTLCEIVKTVLTELSNRSNNASLHDLLGIPDEAGHTVLSELATAAALAALATSVGTPVALDGGTASLAGMLAKLADDLGGADFDATTDSLAKLATALSVAGGFVDQLSASARAVRLASSETLRWNYGDTAPIVRHVTDSAGNAVDLTGATIELAVVENENQLWSDALVRMTTAADEGITITDPTGGEYSIDPSVADSATVLAAVPSGWDGYYSIKCELADGYRYTLQSGRAFADSAQDATLDPVT